MRKLNELYNELRQVHRRLEVDLRGVREAPDYDEGNVHQSEIEIKTIGRSNNRHARKDRENRAPERSGRDGDAAVSSARISLEGSRDITVDKKRATSRAEAPNSGTLGSSAPLETLFNLAPNHTSRSGRDVLAISKKDRNSRGRRHDRMYSVDGNTEFDDSENRLTPRLQRPHRR